MWGSTSAERNENFIKLNRDWFCCFIHKNSDNTSSKNQNKYIQNSSNSTHTINTIAPLTLRRTVTLFNDQHKRREREYI